MLPMCWRRPCISPPATLADRRCCRGPPRRHVTQEYCRQWYARANLREHRVLWEGLAVAATVIRHTIFPRDDGSRGIGLNGQLGGESLNVRCWQQLS